MLVDMIGVPVAHQFLEAVVFYVPSRMSQTDDERGGSLGRRQGRHPHPFGLLLGHLFGELTAHFVGFF
jgi:hypothetical protein